MACSLAEDAHIHTETDASEHSHVPVELEPEPTSERDQTQKPDLTSNQTRSAESHVHGGAVLSIVNENSAVVMEFETPLYNLLGFEYSPRTKEERTSVAQVEARLAQPQTLFQLSSEAKCRYEKLANGVTLFGIEPDAELDPSEHDHEDHEDHEDHIDHEDHHDEHEQEDHRDEHAAERQHDADHASNHTDVILTYKLNCESADKVKNIDISLFDDFPYFAELEIIYLGPSQQISVDVTPSRPKVDLTR